MDPEINTHSYIRNYQTEHAKDVDLYGHEKSKYRRFVTEENGSVSFRQLSLKERLYATLGFGNAKLTNVFEKFKADTKIQNDADAKKALFEIAKKYNREHHKKIDVSWLEGGQPEISPRRQVKETPSAAHHIRVVKEFNEACKMGDLAKVSALWEKHSAKGTSKKMFDAFFAVKYALESKNSDVVAFLMDKDFKINRVGFLQLACMSDNPTKLLPLMFAKWPHLDEFHLHSSPQGDGFVISELIMFRWAFMNLDDEDAKKRALDGLRFLLTGLSIPKDESEYKFVQNVLRSVLTDDELKSLPKSTA